MGATVEAEAFEYNTTEERDYVIIDQKHSFMIESIDLTEETKEDNEQKHTQLIPKTNAAPSYQRILIYYSPTEGGKANPVTLAEIASSISPYTGAPYITHIEICTLHLCKFSDGSYIHINDLPPSDSNFNSLKQSIVSTQKAGIRVLFMLGGAEGHSGTSPSSESTWINLFGDWNTFYPKLVDLIKDWNVQGIDLDCELESEWQRGTTNYSNICKLISSLNSDFGDSFDIAFAPVAEAIYDDMNDGGLSGFNYKTLMNGSYGKYVSWLNLQFYNNWGTLKTPTQYEKCVKTQGFKPQQLVAGMLNCTVGEQAATENTIKSLSANYKTYFGGVYVWQGNYNGVINWSKSMSADIFG